MRATSIETYHAIKQTVIEHHKIILNVLRTHKKGTSRQIAYLARMDNIQVTRRMSELVKQGLVKGEQTVKCSVSGRKVTLWEIV